MGNDGFDCDMDPTRLSQKDTRRTRRRNSAPLKSPKPKGVQKLNKSSAEKRTTKRKGGDGGRLVEKRASVGNGRTRSENRNSGRTTLGDEGLTAVEQKQLLELVRKVNKARKLPKQNPSDLVKESTRATENNGDM